MSAQMTLPIIHSVISSPVSVSGPTLCVWPDGRITDRSGQAVAPASLSPRQAKALGLLTSGTCGQRGFTSSESEGLQSCLANKLTKLSDTDGLISSATTWKRKSTPSGRYVLALTLRGLRLRGNAFTLLPSISAREYKDRSQAQILARLDRGDGVAKRICALSPELRSSREIVGLNPSFAAWMMCLHPIWPSCAPTETPSTLKRQRIL